MKQLVEDVLKTVACLLDFVLAPTPKGQVRSMIRLCRPNWSVSECFRACCWISRNGLQERAAFTSDDEYLTHVSKLLIAYRKAHPVAPPCEVADELHCSHWEARWGRAHDRQRHQEGDLNAAHTGARQAA